MVKMSKALSHVLRISAKDHGLNIDREGYVDLEEILMLPRFAVYSRDRILRLVEESDKKRYSTREDPDTGRVLIRANQGHTIPGVNPGLIPIKDAALYPKVIHGTNREAYKIIRFEGLSKMDRNHVHFAVGEPGEKGVVSGMANESTIHIHLDLAKAIDDGFEFFESINGVVLCSGDARGFIPTRYFSRVYDVLAESDRNDLFDGDFDPAKFAVHNPEKLKTLIHPTDRKTYAKIQRRGLSKTLGNYVNFLLTEPDPSSSSQDLLVYVDVSRLLKAGDFQFLQLWDGEVLCRCISPEYILSEHFRKVIDTASGEDLLS